MKKEKLCMFCQKIIDLKKDKHVLLGTYNGTIILDESYFHFQCWVEYYNSKVTEKAKNVVKGATKKAVGMIKHMIPQNSSGDQVVDMDVEIPDMQEEIPKLENLGVV